MARSDLRVIIGTSGHFWPGSPLRSRRYAALSRVGRNVATRPAALNSELTGTLPLGVALTSLVSKYEITVAPATGWAYFLDLLVPRGPRA